MRTQTVGGVRPAGVEPGREQIKHRYLEALTLIERLHRRLLDCVGPCAQGREPFASDRERLRRRTCCGE